jgi:hypothetical protein
MLLTLFNKTERKGMLPNSFHEGNFIPTPKLDRHTQK